MKKSVVFFLAVFLSVFFISCDSKPLPSLLGTWEANLTLKSELKGADSSAPVAFLYTKQHVLLSFAEGGVYTKKVEQLVDRVELSQPTDDVAAAKEYFSQFFNKNLVFDGEFSQMKGELSFKVVTVQSGTENPLPYLEFFVKDPSIGDEETLSSYELKEDGTLVIDGASFKKAE